ncbi:MAG: CDP-alcohol phosphatidyltransferase family protein [Methanoculleaceae archaeon]
MNFTSLRPRFIRFFDPAARFCIRLGISPNQISLLSLFFGILCAFLYSHRYFLAGSILLIISGLCDLIDGSVARLVSKSTQFGAVFDWIVDKYVDALAIFGVGLSGIPVVSHIIPVPPTADFAIVAIAITGSLMNTFIKPVTYAEIGYQDRVAGKIDDPLEDVGFFGRPETLLVLILGGISGYIWISIILIAICTNLSALQRIIYLYCRFS